MGFIPHAGNGLPLGVGLAMHPGDEGDPGVLAVNVQRPEFPARQAQPLAGLELGAVATQQTAVGLLNGGAAIDKGGSVQTLAHARAASCVLKIPKADQLQNRQHHRRGGVAGFVIPLGAERTGER